jgi:5,10-methylenetetrahydromethanopterin reductase
MRFGIAIAPDSPSETIALARRSESLGMSWFGVADSPLYGDCFAHLALAGASTARISLGPVVTSPVGRHPTVLAGALRTLNAVAPGRVLAAVGSGNSMARGLGARPAPLGMVEAAARQMRNDTGGVTERIRVIVAADGPRGAELAARNPDGWLLGAGIDRTARQELLAAMERRPVESDWDWWLSGTASTSSTVEEAFAEIGPLVVAMGNRALRADSTSHRIPQDLLADVERMNAGYDYEAHAVKGTTANTGLLSPRLTTYLFDRLCLWGDARRWNDRLQQMKDDRVTGVLMFLGRADRAAELEDIGRRLDALGLLTAAPHHLGDIGEHSTEQGATR